MALSSRSRTARCSQGVHVDLVLRALHARAHGLGADLELVGAARQHGRVGRPHDGRLKAVRHRTAGCRPGGGNGHRLASSPPRRSQRDGDRPGPPTARSRSPSIVTIRSTVVVRPAGSTRTGSPGRTAPLGDQPRENPRKSGSGRLTHWTGSRKPPAERPSSASGQAFRGSSAGARPGTTASPRGTRARRCRRSALGHRDEVTDVVDTRVCPSEVERSRPRSAGRPHSS